MTNDTQTNAANPAPASTPAPPQSANKPKSKPKSKPKPRRTRQRRRAADDSSGDEAGAGGGSDTSLSSRSAAEGSESEDEPVTKPVASKSKAKSKSTQPVFADVSSITPNIWSADPGGDDVQPISFEDFSSGKEAPNPSTRGTGLSIRGRGGKGKVESGPGAGNAPKREYTPEETAKYEAQKAKRKEKVKAKKAALKEEKLKGKETANPAINGDGESLEVPAAEPSKDMMAVTTVPAETSGSKSSKAKGKKKSESAAAPGPVAAEQLTTSTAALTLDTTPGTSQQATAETNSGAPAESPMQARPPRQPRGPSHNPNAQRTAEDPKVTPRNGQFWTHDQRLTSGSPAGEGARQMGNSFWRGRAVPRGALRGGFRGRGRGGFFPNARGGFVNGGPTRPVELSQEDDKEEGSSKLAMDREYELAEAREKAKAGSSAHAAATAAQDTTSAEVAEPEVAVQSAPLPPTQPSADRKWGHEGFEAMSAVNHFRGGYRGRVRGARGRGTFFGESSLRDNSPACADQIARGGHLPFAPQNQPFHPAAVAARAAAAAASRSASSPTGSAVSTPAVVNKPKPVLDHREKMSTQPTADSLLDAADESVKIKFPGSAASVVPASAASPTTSVAPPSSIPTTSSPAPAPEPSPSVAAPNAESAAPVSTSSPALESSSEPQFPSMQSSSPAPVAAVQAQMYTGGSNNSPFPMGSENGSVGSGQYVQHPAQFYPAGMTPSGEFVPMQQRPAFYPTQSQRGYPAQSPQFYPPPSPYSPGPYDQHQQRGSFSGAPMASPQGAYFPGTSNGYPNGRNSPLNPYVGQQAGGGYFAPVRGSSKVAIRAPAQSQTPTGEDAASAGEAHSVQANAQSASNGATYYAQHYNPYVQPFVPGQGQRQEAVYYPQANGQQYAWQGYGEQAYYDGNAAYGY